MTDLEKNTLFTEVYELLDIFNEYTPIQRDGVFIVDAVKLCYTQMIDYIVKDLSEAANLKDWLDKTDFWTAPASTKFHGNFKGGLSIHTLMVIKQSLVFAKPMLENFFASPEGEKYTITAKDIFISALCHDFCKTGFYSIEYRNTKDITGNWVKQPFYKTKSDNRNLGHGNESVLMMLEIMPSIIHNRMVIEAVSRHMGFSDLSESESYNYSNFLMNPLVILLQTADQTASQWYGL
ncbi:hypothetical protein [Treponema sp. Marseille-Q3903]|uniref:hypothetical protein n=1 Tax=Treponema sp. Marseille-Q3903 TaxID=2766703 RepID=UPI0016520746|nr:hypothetical protein [Treponema sp. Marseille-Q3903]MBC6713526.1 hypothetical protein [Treponema sp. Marseille-Q3903]